MTRDPRKTTGLIGRACKGRNAFSEAVLMVEAWSSTHVSAIIAAGTGETLATLKFASPSWLIQPTNHTLGDR